MAVLANNHVVLYTAHFMTFLLPVGIITGNVKLRGDPLAISAVESKTLK